MESDYYRATDYESSTLGLGYNSNSRLMPRDRLWLSIFCQFIDLLIFLAAAAVWRKYRFFRNFIDFSECLSIVRSFINFSRFYRFFQSFNRLFRNFIDFSPKIDIFRRPLETYRFFWNFIQFVANFMLNLSISTPSAVAEKCIFSHLFL